MTTGAPGSLRLVDPDPLPARLQAAGFTGVELDMTDLHVRFAARKPGAEG